MRYLAVLIYVTVLVIMASALGCGTDNPICTDSFCLVPRDDVTGEVIELDNAKVLALIDSLAVETPEAVDTGTLAEIVSDTAAGGTAYNGRFVNISGVVEDNYSLNGNANGLTLKTDNELITFFVLTFGQPELLADYENGQTYDFHLFIAEQELSANHDLNNDFSRNVWGHLVQNTDPVVVAPQTLLADARAANQRYQGRVVRITDTVSGNTAETSSIYFNTIGFSIRKNGHPDEATMIKGQSYTFDAFITSIGLNRFTSLPEVRAYLIAND